MALFADYLGGHLLQLSIADVHSARALSGLAVILAGCATLAWTAGARIEPLPSTRRSLTSWLSDSRSIGLMLAILGLSLTIDDAKNICLLLAPVILLDVVRLWREDFNLHTSGAKRRSSLKLVPRWMRVATNNFHPQMRRIASSLVPLLMVPVVTFVVIQYAWPFNSLQFHETWEIGCLLVSFLGLAVRMLASGHISDAAARRADFCRIESLSTDGVFSVVRHPRQLGDYFIGLGVVVIPFVWWLPVAYTLAFYFYYRRPIVAEDERLHSEFGERFEQWAQTTPALVPRLRQWQPARRRFSFRTAIKREYSALLLVIVLHSAVEWLEHLILDRRIMLELFWIVMALAGLSVCILVRYLARHTRVLNVPAS